MTTASRSARSLQDDTAAAVAAVRSSPEATGPRMALFQLAAVCGNWQRARTQLDAMAALDAECGPLAQAYGRLVDAEAVRARVFAGSEKPVALGPPAAWLAMMAEALALDGAGQAESAQALRDAALAAAPACPGTLDGAAFAWLMDADPRIGPVLEVVVEGQYRWLPLDAVRALRAEAPKAMRDVVWRPVSLQLAGGQGLLAYVPARYPGTEQHADDALRLGRETRWTDQRGVQSGLGQRMFASDQGDHPFLDLRELRLDDAGSRDGG